jgi:hypothetical protein
MVTTISARRRNGRLRAATKKIKSARDRFCRDRPRQRLRAKASSAEAELTKRKRKAAELSRSSGSDAQVADLQNEWRTQPRWRGGRVRGIFRLTK